MPEDFLERVRKVVGSSILPDLSELDLSNDLHVDRAAVALVRRFKLEDDVTAYSLLADLVSDRLACIAEQIAQELGLAEASDQLVVNYFEGLFVDMKPPPAESSTFLGPTAEIMKADAEAWIRDIALSSPRDPEGAVVWDDGAATQGSQDGALHLRATRICFHRLDLNDRRILRAKQVEDLSTSQIAQRLDIPEPKALALLLEASQRLATDIDRALKGDSP